MCAVTFVIVIALVVIYVVEDTYVMMKTKTPHNVAGYEKKLRALS